MPAPSITYDELIALDPCSESLRRVVRILGGAKKWNGNKIDAATARAAGCTFNDIVWIASSKAKHDVDVERRVRLWAADCAARVLHVYEETGPSDAPRNAIVAAREYARGDITAASRSAAYTAAWETAMDAAMDAAWTASRSAANAASMAALKAAAWARATATAAEGDAARSAEQQWQFDRIISWLSDNEPADYPLPERGQTEAA